MTAEPNQNNPQTEVYPGALHVALERRLSRDRAAVANLRTINTAQVMCMSVSAGNYGSIAGLIAKNLLDARFSAAVGGYGYEITLSQGNTKYVATAIRIESYVMDRNLTRAPNLWDSRSNDRLEARALAQTLMAGVVPTFSCGRF